MKKYTRLFTAILLAVMMFSMTVMGSEAEDTVSNDEICSYAKDGETCEIWWFYNHKEHWRACVTHDNEAGKDVPVSENEPHEFQDGICTVCGTKETKGNGFTSYIFVFLVVAAVSLLVPMKMQRSFKKNKFDEHPFGLDKFRKL